MHRFLDTVYNGFYIITVKHSLLQNLQYNTIQYNTIYWVAATNVHAVIDS